MNASNCYLEDPSRRSLEYNHFPKISLCCPICAEAGCAVWKGYYKRWLSDPERQFHGQVAVRVALCRRYKKSTAYLPDFAIPYRRTSKSFLLTMTKCWLEIRSVGKTVDRLFQKLDDHHLFDISVVYSLFSLVVTVMQMNPVVIDTVITGGGIDQMKHLELLTDEKLNGLFFATTVRWHTIISTGKDPPR